MKNTTISVNLSSTESLIILYICFFFLLVPITCDDNSYPYHPTENFAVDCGSIESSIYNGRNWYADIASSSSFLELIDGNSSISRSGTPQQSQPSIDTVPFSTARLSGSKFTYVFKVGAGQKFIRLHFYPNFYEEFDPTKAFFSVKANDFTLVSNFSAALAAASLGKNTVTKEFCIDIEAADQRLSLTFTPSGDSHAFINGIEIVSMPNNLYYTPSDKPGFVVIGQTSSFSVANIMALETVYRLNVGGSTIGRLDDTGMYREWLKDDDYVSNVGALPVNWTVDIEFTKIHNYTAPKPVYQTARSMGNDKAENQRYNLTWSLTVDSGFTYMVRLHFCEFQVQVTKNGDREFRIYIANQTAEETADVIVWSGGNGIPFYRDYALRMSFEKGKKTNLTIALHPGSETRSRHLDAILNGLEVFKLTDSDNTLAGSNPNVPMPSFTQPASPSSGVSIQPARSNDKRTGAIVGGVLAGVVATSVLCFLIFRQQKMSEDSSSSNKGLLTNNPSSHTAVVCTGGSNYPLPSKLCRHFSLSEMETATKKFDSEFIIGRGGFGNVYKGYINDGVTPVAIKRLKPGSQQGALEFRTEIEMLSQLRHLNLVSLIGYCNDGGEMILVYDYMSRGTIRDHLYNTENSPLSWKQRLDFCIGAARGLQYLHVGANSTIIHRDVKTGNILLDEKWVAKFSDFGLSKINPNDVPGTHISTVVKGSIGYLDPEYCRRHQLTTKSDVYSFGVVLFEVLCGRPALNKKLEKDQVLLARWAKHCYKNGTVDQIVDRHLVGQIAPKCLEKFTEIAASCLHDDGVQRPSMNDVVWSLEFALQLQESIHIGINAVEDQGQVKEEEENLELDTSDIQESNSEVVMTSSGTQTSFTTTDSDSAKVPPGGVFSEILNPRGR